MALTDCFQYVVCVPEEELNVLHYDPVPYSGDKSVTESSWPVSSCGPPVSLLIPEVTDMHNHIWLLMWVLGT